MNVQLNLGIQYYVSPLFIYDEDIEKLNIGRIFTYYFTFILNEKQVTYRYQSFQKLHAYWKTFSSFQSLFSGHFLMKTINDEITLYSSAI